MRSAAKGSPRSRRRSPVARAAATSQATSASEREREPDQAEVGEHLHGVAVRVADVELVRAVARARDA